VAAGGAGDGHRCGAAGELGELRFPAARWARHRAIGQVAICVAVWLAVGGRRCADHHRGGELGGQVGELVDVGCEAASQVGEGLQGAGGAVTGAVRDLTAGLAAVDGPRVGPALGSVP
jgi:hypothetical protein